MIFQFIYIYIWASESYNFIIHMFYCDDFDMTHAGLSRIAKSVPAFILLLLRPEIKKSICLGRIVCWLLNFPIITSDQCFCARLIPTNRDQSLMPSMEWSSWQAGPKMHAYVTDLVMQYRFVVLARWNDTSHAQWCKLHLISCLDDYILTNWLR